MQIEDNNYPPFLIKKAQLPLLARGGTKIISALPTIGRTLARVGKRQFYGLTGYVPGAGWFWKIPKAQRLAKLEELGVHTAQGRPGLIDRIMRAIRGEEKWKQLRAARAAAAREMIEKGYGTLPGATAGMVRGLKPIRLGWKAMSPGEKLFMGAIGGAGAHEIIKARGRGEPLGRNIASMLAWPALTAVPIAPAIGAWMGAEALGGKLTKRLIPAPVPKTPSLTRGGRHLAPIKPEIT